LLINDVTFQRLDNDNTIAQIT